jgi:bifunctional non-homologous end joining protein LigD
VLVWRDGEPGFHGRVGYVMDLPLPTNVSPMLATAGTPPPGAGWAFEFKWDGVRAVLAVAGDRVRITSRNGNDVTGGYPEVTEAGLGAGRSLLLDGELVALDAGGRPDFGLLQHRMHVRSPAAELREQVPVSLYLFDVLEIDGESLFAEPYDARREQLLALGLDGAPRVAVPPSFTDVTGAQLLDVAGAHRLEGVVAKRRSSRYDPGRRSPAWVKTAIRRAAEVVVAGWTPGSGNRANSLGSLVLAAYDDDRLVYVGDVGTGFTEAARRRLLEQLRGLERADSPLSGEFVRAHGWPGRAAGRGPVRWVEPRLVGEIEYRAFTRDGFFRHPSWRGLRPDRDTREIHLPTPG